MSNKPTITDADIALFRNTIGKVRPVKDDKVHLSSKQIKQTTKLPQASKSKNKTFNSPLSDQGAHDLKSDAIQYFARPNLEPHLLKTFRTGKIPIDAALDLHGLNVEQAGTILQKFIQHSYKQRYQCVCVIHGKGIRAAATYPIMKNHVDIWLRQFSEVLAFCSALPKDGGTGALYVLLKTVPITYR
ncbi:Smr/MutS family protein [soil metagenome]